ncbi:MAG: lactate utilization protein [Negativicutes bacterium]|nr:lactate utilization protein [Negativicutes bacterium]
MKKVCANWEQAFPAENWGPSFFDEFEMRAKNASAEVFRVKTAAEAQEALLTIVKSINAKKVVAVDSPLQQAAGINAALQSLGIEVYTTREEIAAHAESADLGISGVEFAVAETGSVCQDAYAVESRLVSALTPIHVAFLPSQNIVRGMEEALGVISQVFDRGYISFITGPSRTADIERVLTIGVHGPSRFIIIAIDEQVAGGAA